MLWHKHQPDSKWFHTDQNIDTWLNERQELLSLFYKILQITPFEDERDEYSHEDLQDFCGILIDYVSAGHFEIFEKLAAADKNRDVSGFDNKLIQDILKTTQFATEFNLKYAKSTNNINELTGDLSTLGEQLAKRMDLEDRLISIYLKATNVEDSAATSP